MLLYSIAGVLRSVIFIQSISRTFSQLTFSSLHSLEQTKQCEVLVLEGCPAPTSNCWYWKLKEQIIRKKPAGTYYSMHVASLDYLITNSSSCSLLELLLRCQPISQQLHSMSHSSTWRNLPTLPALPYLFIFLKFRAETAEEDYPLVEPPSDDFFCPVLKCLLLHPYLTSCCGMLWQTSLTKNS